MLNAPAVPSDRPLVSAAQQERLRHPFERPVSIAVFLVAATIVVLIVLLLYLGTEWLESRPRFGRYADGARLLYLAVLASPVMAGWARHTRRRVAQQDSIHITPRQLPAIHRTLVAHCRRVGIDVPELYLSDSLERSTVFAWKGRQCIILSTHSFSQVPEAFDDVIDFALASQVGAICLGHGSFQQELLSSLVAPLPFLRAPLSHVRMLSRDRFGAFLAPCAIRALVVDTAGDQLLNGIDYDAYFAEVDEATASVFHGTIAPLFRKRLPLATRVRQLRLAGLPQNTSRRAAAALKSEGRRRRPAARRSPQSHVTRSAPRRRRATP